MPRKKSAAAKAREEEGERPAKRVRLLADDHVSDTKPERAAGGVSLFDHDEEDDAGDDDGRLKINDEFARRFEHNEKRAERHRLEEKYKNNGGEFASDSESTSEEEDDDGDLVTTELDQEISATLKALRSKDPRIYDKKVAFFAPVEDDDAAVEPQVKQEKPVYLKDYHRQNLLNGAADEEERDDVPPVSYAAEQDAIKDDLVRQLHEAGNDNDASDEDDFLSRKQIIPADGPSQVHPSRREKLAPTKVDVENAEKDPETFLSNFMASRAWVPSSNSRFAHLDSDDSSDDDRADEFEQAYNMRFEDPDKANAKLVSFARDVGKYSARREEKTGRAKQREKEREIKEMARKERHDEKARLRRLRIEEVEAKVKQIKEAAGLGPADVLNLEEWGNMLEGDFDDDNWETEMQHRFGEKYYAEKEGMDLDGEDENNAPARKKDKVKKPKWDDDIEIGDLVPDFETEANDADKPAFTLSSDDEQEANHATVEASADTNGTTTTTTSTTSAKPKSKKELLADRKRAARRQRMAIEELVDADLTLGLPGSTSSNTNSTTPQNASRPVSGFRYRATSPTSFGLSARDILFADDTALNNFAGLKKTHAFRDEEKKARDRKKLGKKARLREWRRETFGDEEGYRGEFADYVRSKGGDALLDEQRAGGNKEEGRKRKRKDKGIKA